MEHPSQQTEPKLSDRLKFLREEVKFEYQITAQRVAWFLTSQTFLISAFVLGFFNPNVNIAKDFFWTSNSYYWNDFILASTSEYFGVA